MGLKSPCSKAHHPPLSIHHHSPRRSPRSRHGGRPPLQQLPPQLLRRHRNDSYSLPSVSSSSYSPIFRVFLNFISSILAASLRFLWLFWLGGGGGGRFWRPLKDGFFYKFWVLGFFLIQPILFYEGRKHWNFCACRFFLVPPIGFHDGR